ncbi:MAG TPA: efflux RND transporter periplasmic adaptor subunit [Opitutaceae bacterium]
MRPAVSIALLAALLTGGCHRAESPAARPALPAIAVKVQPVVSASRPQSVAVPATIRPAQRAAIAAQVTGVIREFPVVLGQSVRAGDLLVHVSAPETEARLAQARAQLAEAERIVARERKLSSTGANALDSVKDAEARVRLAQAAVSEAEAMLAHSLLRAPFAGTVVETQVLRGDLAAPGAPLLVLESTEHLRAEGALPESVALAFRIGDPLRVRTADGVLEGTIAELSLAADPVTRARALKVSLPAGKVRSGQLVQLLAPGPAVSGLFAPAAAIRVSGQMEQLFVVSEGRASLRLVRTGASEDGNVEILAGVTEGEQVVIAPSIALRDGQPVTVQP